MPKFFHFFLVKIILGIAAIVGVVFLTQTLGQTLLLKTSLSQNKQGLILALLNSGFALAVYILLFRVYEKRKISELSASNFFSFASIGFVSGFVLQSLFILVIQAFIICLIVSIILLLLAKRKNKFIKQSGKLTTYNLLLITYSAQLMI